jgi:putative ABC transport system permease protein
MPAGFRFPDRDDEVYLPLALDQKSKARRGSFGYHVIGRLKPGVRLEKAKAEMATIASRLEEQYRNILEGYGVNLVPLHRQVVGRVEVALWVLLGIVASVLLIACANVANLLLARAAVREREIAIRTALGAGRRRLVKQLLTESMLLGFLGGSVGLLIAFWGLKALVAISPEDIPRLDQIGMDGRVLAFTLGISLLTGLVFGLVPALQASKFDLNESLKEGGRSSTGGIQGRRVRSLLVVFEIAASLILLIGAGLMIRSFMRLQEVNLGFNPDRLLTMNLQLSRTKFPEGRQVATFYNDLFRRVESLPGVKSVGATSAIFIEALPNSSNFTIEGRPPLPAAEQIEAPLDSVSPNYFRTMGIRLLKGREFNDRDGPDSPNVVIINNTFSQRFWPVEDPLGKRFKFGGPDSRAPWLSIVGVVADMRRTGFEADVRCETFLPYSQNPVRFATLVVRTANDPLKLAATVRDAIWAMNADQPVSHIGTVDQLLDQMMAQRRLNMVLFGIFAGVALILAAVGIYGITSYSVTQRTHEIGIRMTLGADSGDVLRLILGHGALLASTGVAVGLIGALLLTRVMSSLLYEVSATDPTTFAVISLILITVALLASYVPAHRATKVDPMVALRYE